MLMFYDESGTFTFPLNGSAISLVGILVIPEDSMKKIEQKYSKIRATLPLDKAEVKGRLLNEKQVDKVIGLLAKNDVLFIVVAIDMSLHSKEGIEQNRNELMSALTADLNDKHHVNIIKRLSELSERLSKMPQQLFIQSVLTFDVIKEALELATLYYCQRRPKVLQRFEWIIDAKNKDKITNWEDWWFSTMMPIMQARSISNPIKQINGGDYSYFERFYTDIPEFLRPHIDDPDEKSGLDMRKIMTESFKFSSDSDTGLELVDILTNATRRALIGNLSEEGWQNMPKLMVHQNTHYIKLIGLEDFDQPKVVTYSKVVNHFRRGGKVLLAKNMKA